MKDSINFNKQLKLFTKVNYETKIEILKHQKTLFHKLKGKNKDQCNAELTLLSLVHAIKEVTSSFDDVTLRSITLRGKNIKVEVKKEKLLSHWAIVKTLKIREKMSYRQISEYLKKYHKFDISYSTIQKTWNTVERRG